MQASIGVPYARKHHEPHHCACEGCVASGRQLYREPLFLDCCGLVRRVVRRLQRQLGFRLGPWNQAYQYDTLPLRLESADQLKPGDLIFYSGTYLQPGSKRHAFDITHVEVFVGGATGEATIGSRERYKWVMEYPSFKFTPSRWKLITHHFCSIDTWLDGVCVPRHPEMWRRRRHTAAGTAPSAAIAGAGAPAAALPWDARKYSIFGAVGLDAEPEADDGDEEQSDGADAMPDWAAPAAAAGTCGHV
ncbi:hypothetical protein GPECTOR_36g35 [Gonium pectorale]|uniref:NlpC/P60 domain-containing protein n=1 Tax=Gonium pectorale TaxID=33097 RepID=A0A150GD95_GONPE|nr:hypothetical protein GPECTOR_36g35 [Gonium pectorale]|eukprot:KXZ47310.1 hypothetical protein GPECTOR_36g35 [Gonium pectorale]